MAAEKDLETKLKKAVELLGGKAFKWVSPGTTGIPDRIVLMPHGLKYFVELKAPTGSMSKRQIFMKREIEKLGHRVYELYDETDLTKFLKLITAANEINF